MEPYSSMIVRLLSILALALTLTCYAIPSDTLTPKQMENKNAIKQMHSSYEGVTPAGNKYSVYGVKLKRKWTLLVIDSVSILSYKYDRKTDSLMLNSDGYTDMICTAMRAKMVKEKRKPKFVADMVLAGYYKMSTKGLRLFQRINSTEQKVKRVESQAKKAAELAKKMKKLKK